jgi:hypothetical protein
MKLRPKWEDRDPQVRLAGVAELNDQRILADIAINDERWQVRWDAIAKLTKKDVLSDIARTERIKDLRDLAARQLNSLAREEPHAPVNVSPSRATTRGASKYTWDYFLFFGFEFVVSVLVACVLGFVVFMVPLLFWAASHRPQSVTGLVFTSPSRETMHWFAGSFIRDFPLLPVVVGIGYLIVYWVGRLFRQPAFWTTNDL